MLHAPRFPALVLVLALLLPAVVRAQAPEEAPPLEADPADVETVDGLMHAVYEVISGPAGQARDWDRFRSLFHPSARLIPVQPTQDGGFAPAFLSVDDYIEWAGAYLERNGFFEREIYRSTEAYGHVLHAFSTYESRHKAEDPEPFVRGINSFQLMHDGARWWVLNIFWDSERPGQPIPAQYLPE
ncbi:hypothetical protein [Rhodocaloribacter sp.]